MYIADLGLKLSEAPFTVLFTQDGAAYDKTSSASQNFDLIIDVSDNEFSTEECLDLSIDHGLDSNAMNETFLLDEIDHNDAIMSRNSPDVTSAGIPALKGHRSNDGGLTVEGIDQAVSSKRPQDAESSDEDCLDGNESNAKKGRFKFLRETEPIIVVHSAASSSNANLVVSDADLPLKKLFSAEDQLVSAESTTSEHSLNQNDVSEQKLKLSELCTLFHLSPKEASKGCSIEECDANTDGDFGSEDLIALTEPTDIQFSTSPSRLHQIVNKVIGATGSAMSAQNVMNRLGPKVNSCDRVVLICKSSDVEPGEAGASPDRHESRIAEGSLDPFRGVRGSPQNALSDSSEILSNSSPANSNLSIDLNVGVNVNAEIPKEYFGGSEHPVPFVSSDPQENDDNSDPNWKYLCSLDTDDERYKIVRKRWKNLDIPNPNRNLTLQNYRNRQEVNGKVNVNVYTHVNNKRKRSLSEVVEPMSKRLCISSATCTDVFHAKIDNVRADFCRKEQELKSRFQEQVQRFNAGCFNEINAMPSRFNPLQDRHIFQKNDQQDQKVRNLSYKYDETLKNFKNECVRMEARLTESMEEIITVQNFYCGLKNSSNVFRNANELSKQQMTEIVEQDCMYSKYDRIYQ